MKQKIISPYVTPTYILPSGEDPARKGRLQKFHFVRLL